MLSAGARGIGRGRHCSGVVSLKAELAETFMGAGCGTPAPAFRSGVILSGKRQ